jgi:hypothetical protein
MNYRVFVKQQLMTGKMYKVCDVGISTGSHPSIQLNHYHNGGIISYRAVVGPLFTDFEGNRDFSGFFRGPEKREVEAWGRL